MLPAPSPSSAIQLALVDDDPYARGWLKSNLERAHEVRVVAEAGSAAEALLLAASVPLDVMLVDIGMRQATGICLTGMLKKYHPDIGVLICSMHSKVAYVNSATHAGARGYVLKNPDPHEILRAVVTVARGEAYYGTGVPRPDARARAPRPELTQRELEVLRLIAAGLKNQVIAQRLGIALSTVMRHRLNLREKLGLDTVIEIRKYAEDHGLLSED